MIIIITYTIFIIDVGTLVYQQLSNLDVIFFTCYAEGRRVYLCLWNKGHGNTTADKLMNIQGRRHNFQSGGGFVTIVREAHENFWSYCIHNH